MPVEAFEQQLVVEVDEGTVAPNSPITSEGPDSESTSRFAAIQPFINLEEEPMATDVKESEGTVDLLSLELLACSPFNYCSLIVVQP